MFPTNRPGFIVAIILIRMKLNYDLNAAVFRFFTKTSSLHINIYPDVLETFFIEKNMNETNYTRLFIQKFFLDPKYNDTQDLVCILHIIQARHIISNDTAHL